MGGGRREKTKRKKRNWGREREREKADAPIINQRRTSRIIDASSKRREEARQTSHSLGETSEAAITRSLCDDRYV